MHKKLFLASLFLFLVVAIGTTTAADAKSRKSSHRSHYGLVPPPPPTAVSPSMLAAYPQYSGGRGMVLMPSKPKNVAEEMHLTAVMDDVAFFKVSSTGDESIHLKQGNCYQNVTVAQITQEQVVLEEKGHQYIKYLK